MLWVGLICNSWDEIRIQLRLILFPLMRSDELHKSIYSCGKSRVQLRLVVLVHVISRDLDRSASDYLCWHL